MKRITWIILTGLALITGRQAAAQLPEAYLKVDRVLWVVDDIISTRAHYSELGFTQVLDLGTVQVSTANETHPIPVKLALANLGGAQVIWIESLGGRSLFRDFLETNGEGAMSLVHRFSSPADLEKEVRRLGDLGIGELDRITFRTGEGEMHFVLMDTREKGKYLLGFNGGTDGEDLFAGLGPGNRNGLKLSQYAFAARDPEPVSAYWSSLGLPAFAMNHPVLGDTHYYGEIVDHALVQGWQRHGSIAYEWCIPVRPPIVYEDHIRRHGEGIHHLAFNVADMDQVLGDYTERGYVVSMGGTWGEKGKPGSGRYEYIDLEKAGGLTMELLWNYSE